MSDPESTAPRPPDFELVLASLLGGVVALSSDDRISFVNPSAELMLQRSLALLVGQPVTVLAAGMPWLAELLAHSKASPESSVRGEGRIGGRGGTDVVAYASTLRDRAGKPDGTVVVIHDVSSRQWLYDDELARTRLTELDNLVSRVAHELNNPLAGIRGAAQLLGSKLADTPDLARYTEMIVRQADRLAQLVKGLLALEAPPPEMEALNIHRVLNDVILLGQTEAEARGVHIATAFDPSLPEVRGNHDQLEQLLLNLLKNAIAACPAGKGHITVSTRMEHRFYIETPSERVRYIVVEVVDNGPGLDEETLAHMFTPFFSRREGGSGLGLAIAHNIATAHKGRLAADNAETGGARLRLALPVAEVRRATPPSEAG